MIDPRRLQALRHPACQSPRRDPHQQHGRRRAHGRAGGNRVRRARPRLHQEHSPISSRSWSRAIAACRCCSRTSPASSSPPDERRGITEMNGEGEVVSRHRAAALRRERARGDPQRQGASRRDGAEPAAGRDDRGGLRPLRPDLSRHRHAQAHADRGKRDRRAGLRRVPAARAQRAGRHHHAAARRADRLSLHASAGLELQHHEPRRHRDRDRRHGRCRHRDDRERPQASRAGAARQTADHRC